MCALSCMTTLKEPLLEGGGFFPRLSRASSDDESVREGYFWANIDSTWTILDQKRLVSMDYLYHRSLEFHNNHHTFRATGDYDYTKDLGAMDPNEIAFEIFRFEKNRSLPSPKAIQCNEIRGFLNRFQFVDHEIVWFNIKDLRALAPLGNFLKLHNVTLSHFYDLRGHSSVNAVDNGIFASFCSVTLFGDDAELHKVYTFTAKRFVITYERELIAEPEDEIIPNPISAKSVDVAKDLKSPSPFTRASRAIQSLRSAAKSPLPNQSSEQRPSPSVDSATNSEASSPATNSHQTPATPKSPTRAPAEMFLHGDALGVVNQLKYRMTAQLHERVVMLGSIYILYEIGTETLANSDTLIEFISRTIFHLKQQIHRSMSYRQKLHFHRKIGILLANVRMIATFIEEICQNLRQTLNKSSSEFDILLSGDSISWEQIVYISCLIDSYEFKATCLHRQLHDVQSMETAMSNVTAVRSEKTSINFTLIATVFLPLTFFAGIFGMNFQVDGGYTMEILNRKHGPEFFWLLCGLVILLNIYFFLSTGLITLYEKDGILSPDGGGSRWKSTSSVATDDLNFAEDGASFAADLLTIDQSGGNDQNHSFSERVSMDKRSLQEEYRRLTFTKARRQRDARQY